jgi:hypothetical protein
MTPATDAAREARERLAAKCLADHGRAEYGNPNVIRAMLAFADTEAASQPREGDLAAIRRITAEMRRLMPNACGDWADNIDAALAPPVPLTAAESGELAGYIHGKDYRDNTIEAVEQRKLRFNDLLRRDTLYRQSLTQRPPEQAGAEMQTAANTSPDELARIQLLADVELHLKSCRIFLTTREKIHPCGVELHDEIHARVTAAINEGKHNG